MLSVTLVPHFNDDDDLRKMDYQRVLSHTGSSVCAVQSGRVERGRGDGGERPHGRKGISLALIVIVLENIRPLEFHHRAAVPTMFMSSAYKFISSCVITEVFFSCHERAENGIAKVTN